MDNNNIQDPQFDYEEDDIKIVKSSNFHTKRVSKKEIVTANVNMIRKMDRKDFNIEIRIDKCSTESLDFYKTNQISSYNHKPSCIENTIPYFEEPRSYSNLYHGNSVLFSSACYRCKEDPAPPIPPEILDTKSNSKGRTKYQAAREYIANIVDSWPKKS